jgi:hypothetical protein
MRNQNTKSVLTKRCMKGSAITEGLDLKKLISVMLAVMMLLLTTAAVVIAAENAAHEAPEKENKTSEQLEKNTSVTEKVTEGAKEATAKATEETAEKKQPGFEAVFAAAGLMAVAFVALKRRS